MGETSNPGPPFVSPPNPAFCPDDVLASLEADLTRSDSDDERRVGLLESASHSVCPVGHI